MPILIEKTPFGCKSFLTSVIKILETNIVLISFIPPVVDPAHPPIKRRKNMIAFESPSQFSKSTLIKPVVVINDRDEKTESLIDTVD